MKQVHFFIGRLSQTNQDVILIDFNTSSFITVDGDAIGGATEPTQVNIDELDEQIEMYKKNRAITICFPFPYSSKELYYESFSDQDLSNYANMKNDNPNTRAFGILGFYGNNTFGIFIVQAINVQKIGEIRTIDFYMYPNIYYFIEDTIYKMGHFEKIYVGRTTGVKETIVKNARVSFGRKMVSAISSDPNTGEKIVDQQVGYIDLSGTLYFNVLNEDCIFSDVNNPRNVYENK